MVKRKSSGRQKGGTIRRGIGLMGAAHEKKRPHSRIKTTKSTKVRRIYRP